MTCYDLQVLQDAPRHSQWPDRGLWIVVAPTLLDITGLPCFATSEK